MKQRPWCALLALLGMAACKGNVQAPLAADDARVQALVGKTLSNLRRIDGGSFWQGDFGVLMSDEDKAADKAPGPDAKPGAGLPFTMGDDNKPPRWVTLKTFYLGAYKVTYGDFDVYTQANGLPAHPPNTEDVSWQRIWQKLRTADDVPAGVNWPQAKGYCQWMGHLTGLPFDLPTEAQWEFAASEGKNRRRKPFPTASGTLDEGKAHPTYDQVKKMMGQGRVYPVGRFPPSPNGFYDLVGNGYDWVNDWYAPDAYQSGPAQNPTGPLQGTEKVLRGYSTGYDWYDFPHLHRHRRPPDGRSKWDEGPGPTVYGAESFRCAVNVDALKTTASTSPASATPTALR